MPYLPTAQEWLTQSALLLEARPRTTRITTKYTLSKPIIKPRTPKPSKEADPTKSSTTTAEPQSTEPDPALASTATATQAAIAAPPSLPTTRAILILKTYDPTSGVTLKYKTDKAAEVGRLVSSLARLGRAMAGLPELKEEDVVTADAQAAKVEGAAEGADSGATGSSAPVPDKGGIAGGGGQPGGQQGGKKGKKKGKK